MQVDCPTVISEALALLDSSDRQLCWQVEGAFIQGLGYLTSEEVRYDETTGHLLTNGTWKYKPPAASCIPQEMNIEFLKVGLENGLHLYESFDANPQEQWLLLAAFLCMSQSVGKN